MLEFGNSPFSDLFKRLVYETGCISPNAPPHPPPGQADSWVCMVVQAGESYRAFGFSL